MVSFVLMSMGCDVSAINTVNYSKNGHRIHKPRSESDYRANRQSYGL
jgi:hypothetical protein